jgi:AcrR family transcriptional regulator
MVRRDQTREKLLTATLELISEKGYTGATTREIASRAGVSELTLFRRFGKKETLFEEMLDEFSFLPRLRNLIDEVNHLPVEEGLKIIGVQFLETLRERRPIIQILLSEMSHYPRKVRKITQQMIETMARTLESYLAIRQDRDEIKPIDTDLVAIAILRVLFMTFFYEFILKGSDMDDDQIETTVGRMIHIFLYGIAEKSEV